MQHLTAALITEYPIPTANTLPQGIVAGPDGRLWFAEGNGMANNIGAITTAGVVTEYPITMGGAAQFIASNGTDLWTTIAMGDFIGKVTTAGVFTYFHIVSGVNVGLNGITNGPDGNLWFTELVANKIGRITPVGVITEFSVPLDPNPYGITSGPDGNLWFTSGGGNSIVKMNTAGMVLNSYVIPTANSGPTGITNGPDGNLWFSEFSGNKIGKITTAGVITEYTIPTANSGPLDITVGSDGNLWFTESTGNDIGRITTAGVITEYPVPTGNSTPFGITSGPDNNIWFTENAANQVGVLDLSNLPPTPSGAGSFIGKRKINDFGIAYEYFNSLTWEGVTIANLSGYALYRNGVLIAELDADENSYQDHNRNKSEVDTYTLYPFNAQGLGTGITITVGDHS